MVRIRGDTRPPGGEEVKPHGVIVGALAASLIVPGGAALAESPNCRVQDASGTVGNSSARVYGWTSDCKGPDQAPTGGVGPGRPGSATRVGVQEPVRTGPRVGDPGSPFVRESCAGGGSSLQCQAAVKWCAANSPDTKGPVSIIRHLSGAFEGYDCGDEPGKPRARVPRVPSLGEIQSAFRELPFCKPSPSIQPVGGKTLVNLPTYFQAAWPARGGCLRPGQVSKPVRLLSWRVEFRVEAQGYRYSFGDRAMSEWTTSTGGTSPDGDITHTYTTAGTRQVKVDARLTGSYRVNGGAWREINTVADLRNEPTITYQVVTARSRLHAN